MYHAIVLLPLLGSVIAALMTLIGAHARHPGATPPAGGEDHARPVPAEDRARGAPLPDASACGAFGLACRASVDAGSGRGSRMAELVTTVLLFACMVLSWIAFADVGIAHHDSRIPLFSWITAGDLKVDWSLRVDTLTAVMLVVVTTISAFVHLYSMGYMQEDPHRPRFFSYLSLFTFAMLMLVTSNNWDSSFSDGKASG